MANIAPPPQGNPPAQPQGGQQANQPAQQPPLPPLAPFARDWQRTPAWARVAMGVGLAGALLWLYSSLPSRSYAPKKAPAAIEIIDEDGRSVYEVIEPSSISALKDLMAGEGEIRVPRGYESRFARAVKLELSQRRRSQRYRFMNNADLTSEIVNDFDAEDGFDGSIKESTIDSHLNAYRR